MTAYNYYSQRRGKVWIVMMEVFVDGEKVVEHPAGFAPQTDPKLADRLAESKNDECFACRDHIALHSTWSPVELEKAA